jgi:hypothetical protein
MTGGEDRNGRHHRQEPSSDDELSGSNEMGSSLESIFSLIKKIRTLPMPVLLVLAGVLGAGLGAGSASSPQISTLLNLGSSTVVDDRVISGLVAQYRTCLNYVEDDQNQRFGDLDSLQLAAVRKLEDRHAEQLSELKLSQVGRDARQGYVNSIDPLGKDYKEALKLLEIRSKIEAEGFVDRCEGALAALPRAYRDSFEQAKPDGKDAVRDNNGRFRARVSQLEGEYDTRAQELRNQFLGRLGDLDPTQDGQSGSRRSGGVANDRPGATNGEANDSESPPSLTGQVEKDLDGLGETVRGVLPGIAGLPNR